MIATTTRQTVFIEPLDVLFLRGNKLFGDPGSYGESLVPPWPSVVAGAIRSALLAHKGVDLSQFAKGEVSDPELGTPANPGPFRVTGFQLARRFADGRIERLYAPPADLVIRRNDADTLECVLMQPRALPSGIQSSAATRLHAVLPERERTKPESGYWLTHAGWSAYVQGGEIDPTTMLVKTSDLWGLDTRVGVGLDPAKRSAAEGKLFTVQAVAMRKRHHGQAQQYDVGFLAQIDGATLPQALMLRFGGDGRAARATVTSANMDTPDVVNQILQSHRCRLILTSPGIFQDGWLPTGCVRQADGSISFDLHGVRGRLVCAAVPRAEVVSGWDLAKWQPKPAKRAAPMGSVYWLDELDATPDALRTLLERGLWSEPCEDAARRAEGFNRATIAAWPKGSAS
jgi:CRISPR-associated protein Cmr3